MFRLKPRTSIVNEGPEYSVIPGRSPPAGSLISNLRSLARSILSASPAWIMISQAGGPQKEKPQPSDGNNPTVLCQTSAPRDVEEGARSGGERAPPPAPAT